MKRNCEGELKMGKNQSINQMQSTRMSRNMLREVFDQYTEESKITYDKIPYETVKLFLHDKWCTGQLEFDDLYQRMLLLNHDDVQQILEPYIGNHHLGGLYRLVDETFVVAQDNKPLYKGRFEKSGDYWFVASGQHRFGA